MKFRICNVNHGSSGRVGYDKQLYRNVSPCSGKVHESETLAGSSNGWNCQRFESFRYAWYGLRYRWWTGKMTEKQEMDSRIEEIKWDDKSEVKGESDYV